MYYDLAKPERETLAKKIHSDLLQDLHTNSIKHFTRYFADEDTYIRKAAYLAVGKIYTANTISTQVIIARLQHLLNDADFKIRQATVNTAGEIGKTDFGIVQQFFDTALFDKHHAVRNAVIGSVKKMGEKNPEPVLNWAKKYLHHPDKEIRREICHGIELRGRTHPEDILLLLQELEFDAAARVYNTLVHVIGQISYKKGCLETVIATLNNWNNKELVEKAIDEIIDVHYRYRDFAILTQEEARDYIRRHYKG